MTIWRGMKWITWLLTLSAKLSTLLNCGPNTFIKRRVYEFSYDILIFFIDMHAQS